MSAVGTKRTFALVATTSASDPKGTLTYLIELALGAVAMADVALAGGPGLKRAISSGGHCQTLRADCLIGPLGTDGMWRGLNCSESAVAVCIGPSWE